MTKNELIGSFVALGVIAAPAAATTTKAPTEKAKVHKNAKKNHNNVKEDSSASKSK